MSRMKGKGDGDGAQGKTPADERAARLKAALKANMARRKAQAKGRASSQDGDAGRSGEGFGESPGDD